MTFSSELHTGNKSCDMYMEEGIRHGSHCTDTICSSIIHTPKQFQLSRDTWGSGGEKNPFIYNYSWASACSCTYLFVPPHALIQIQWPGFYVGSVPAAVISFLCATLVLSGSGPFIRLPGTRRRGTEPSTLHVLYRL